MGDRCYMCLIIKSEHFEEAKKIFTEAGNRPGYQSQDNGHGFASLEFEEVNYAKLEGIETVQAAGIPYDLDNTAGHEYEAACVHCRFTERGEMVLQELTASDDVISVNSLLKVIDDHAALKSLIQKADEERAVLPWDNQVEYGKRYVARQLIQP